MYVFHFICIYAALCFVIFASNYQIISSRYGRGAEVAETNWPIHKSRRVSRGGGPKGPAPPPPLEIEKQKKKSSEQIVSYFTYILLLF